MIGRLFLFVPLLSVAFLASATPLEARDPTPGLIEDLLKGALNDIGRLIKDILDGVKSGISDELEGKPPICLGACCKCMWSFSLTLTTC
jgi:L-ascorbate peroxidase